MTPRVFASSRWSWLTMGPGEDASGTIENEHRAGNGGGSYSTCQAFEKLRPARYAHLNICSGWQRQCQAGGNADPELQGQMVRRGRGKPQLGCAGILLPGEGSAAISFSEPALTQRGAEHSGDRSCKVANSALTKALTKN